MQKQLEKAQSSLINGALYVVATPIGNLSDISLRALAVLSCADVIFAEDTRVSAKLLSAYGLKKNLISLREHNEQEMAAKVIALLREGKIIAQVSDAGTPAICDPGGRLVAAVRAASLPVYPILGACALIGALSAAGIVGDDFYFGGFLAPKSGERLKQLQARLKSPETLIFYETPHRIQAALKDIYHVFPDVQITLVREISKTFETYLSGSPDVLLALLEQDKNQNRGEMVLLIHPRKPMTNLREGNVAHEKIIHILAAQLPTKQAADLAAQIIGINKKILYDEIVSLKSNTSL